MNKRILISAIVTIVIIGMVSTLVNASTEVQLERVDFKTKEQEIDTLQKLQDTYQIELEKADKDIEELEQLRLDQEKLKKENERLQQELAVKKAKQAEEAKQRSNVAYASEAAPVRTTVAPTGTCADWIAAAGISDVGNANELIRRESGCNPLARNPSSGACGVAQELPCGKSGCTYGDGACQVNWMNSYVISRYGSWSAAVAFHNSNNWY